MEKNKLAEFIDATINSMDGATKATPALFLLTRINARLLLTKEENNSMWERLRLFLSRPSVAFATLAFIILLNVLLYNYSSNHSGINDPMQSLQAVADENPMSNASALFDIENFQP
jgi:hypothetical protein